MAAATATATAFLSLSKAALFTLGEHSSSARVTDHRRSDQQAPISRHTCFYRPATSLNEAPAQRASPPNSTERREKKVHFLGAQRAEHEKRPSASREGRRRLRGRRMRKSTPDCKMGSANEHWLESPKAECCGCGCCCDCGGERKFVFPARASLSRRGVAQLAPNVWLSAACASGGGC